MFDLPFGTAGLRSHAAAARRGFAFLALLATAAWLVCGAARASTSEDSPPPAISPAQQLAEMGKFFELSEPPSKDLAKARDLYCRAAVLGHPEAIRRLGWLYYKGEGVAANPHVAGTLFGWAAQLGDERAVGLAAAAPAPFETVPPCIAQSGLHSLAALRARLEPAPAPAPAPAPLPNAVVENPAQFRTEPPQIDRVRLVQTVLQEARAFRLDPRLVLAVIRAESNFDPAARSPKNAQGLMQLIPDTALRFNVQDAFDPVENLRGGMAYLRWLLAYYRGDVPLVLAAYNAGEGAVDRFRGVPPYAETLGYVQRIRALYPFDRHPYDRRVLAAHERSWIDRDMASAGR